MPTVKRVSIQDAHRQAEASFSACRGYNVADWTIARSVMRTGNGHGFVAEEQFHGMDVMQGIQASLRAFSTERRSVDAAEAEAVPTFLRGLRVLPPMPAQRLLCSSRGTAGLEFRWGHVLSAFAFGRRELALDVLHVKGSVGRIRMHVEVK